jgi:hypothetical protein
MTDENVNRKTMIIGDHNPCDEDDAIVPIISASIQTDIRYSAVAVTLTRSISDHESTTHDDNIPFDHSSFTAPEAQFVTIDGDPTPADESTPLVISSSYSDNDNNLGNQSEVGPLRDFAVPVFRDWPFAILFCCHLAAMIYVGVVYCREGYRRVVNGFDLDLIEQEIAKGDDVKPEDLAQLETFVEDAYHYLQGYPQRILLYNILPTAVLLFFVMDIMVTTSLLWFTTFWVTKTLLISMTLIILGMAALLIVQPTVLSIVVATIVIGSSVYFTCSVWSIIPFLSVNLKIALQGMRSNFGTYMWALLLSDLSSVFVLVWAYGLIGIWFYEMSACEDGKNLDGIVQTEDISSSNPDAECSINGWTFLIFLLSLYWTTNVIGNFLQVVVAGVMATWLYDKDEARGCCSGAIWGSLRRGVTYSFGSICYGSLVQGFMSFLRWMTQGGRRIDLPEPNRSNDACCGTMGSSFVDCVSRHLKGDILDWFTQWNYIYVALYGFSYVESGKRVTQLFQTKGFFPIISERLAGFALGGVTASMGILGGIIVLLVERVVTLKNPDPQYESFVYGPLPNWRIAAFLYVYFSLLVCFELTAIAYSYD